MSLGHGANIVTNGLVLCLDAANPKSYPGSGTTWYDLSGNGNNGTLVNSPTFDSNNKGSIVFNGSNNYVTLGNDKFKYQDNFSVEAICKFPSLPNNTAGCVARHPIIYNHDYGYNLLVMNTGKIVWNIYNTSGSNIAIVSNASIVGSNYFHVIGIKIGTLCSLYINGVFENSSNLSTNAVYYTSNPFVVGGYAFCGGNRFYATGNISKISVYNKSLSTTEIQQNFNALRGRYNI